MPRTGPCSPWITGRDVASQPSIIQAVADINDKAAKRNPPLPGFSADQVEAICAAGATSACELLYSLTARQFTGLCGPVTIRPVARPANADSRGWVFAAGGGWGYGWGASAAGVLGTPPVLALYAEDMPPYIMFHDYPIRQVLEVKINGVVIPSDEYEVREGKYLIRMMPTSSSVPTELYGWPSSQRQNLPDTEQGTFSVTYTFGQDPGQMGRMAAIALAENIIRPIFGDANAYPERVTTITRQGVSAQIASVIDIMKTGGTGIRTVDLWIMSVNPNKLRKRPKVWSPDIGRNPRQQRPSIPR
jgi:hypothetical protein